MSKEKKRLDAIERDVAHIKELLGTQKFKKDSILKDLHTMILNTDFLLYNVRSMGENIGKLQEQHEQQMKPLFTEVNLKDSFIKSKGLHNEYQLYRKDQLEKQQLKREEAEAKAKEEAEGQEQEQPDDPGTTEDGTPDDPEDKPDTP